jgi:arylsulfatase A-like enzyme
VPAAKANDAGKDLAGYYAHIAALDDCAGKIVRTLQECNIEDNTMLVFTSDHGDMLYSQGQTSKQRPWDESILVPFLLRYPAKLGNKGKVVDVPINTPDIMPTILGLSSVDILQSCEGKDYSAVITGAEKRVVEKAALIMCPVPFHQWNYKKGGREYRGVRTKRYTYVRDIKSPWLLYDNDRDPYQFTNLCDEPNYRDLQSWLDKLLNEKLEETNDQFLTGQEYMRLWDYEWDRDDAPVKA